MGDHAVESLRRMMLIRAFETALAKRRDHGFQLLSTGEEAVAVGLCSASAKRISFSPAAVRSVRRWRAASIPAGSRRNYSANRPASIAAKAGAGTWPMSASGFFGAHAVVGGNISIAAGVALAKKMERKGGLVAVLFGDGACGAGGLHETLNMAAIWKLPLLFVCNNNQLSVSARRADVPRSEKTFRSRRRLRPARANRRRNGCRDGRAGGDGSRAHGARGRRPGVSRVPLATLCLALDDRARNAQSAAALAEIRLQCPIRREAERLRAAGILSADASDDLEKQAQAQVCEAFAFADASPYPDAAEVLTDVE